MTNKEKYRNLCKKEPTIPIFSKDWWLDAVVGAENWDVSIVENGNQIVAAMPYYFRKEMFFRIITMPKLTQNLGIWIKYPEDQKYERRLSFEKEVMISLIDSLPKFDYFLQNLHYSVTNWLPFYWRNFNQTTRYTYVIDSLDNLVEVYSGFKSNVRNKIIKASKIVNVEISDNIDLFYEINQMTFERQGIVIPYSLEFVRRIDKVLKEKDSRCIFLAKDDNGNIHSALYLIWDEMSSYVHMVGENPALRSSGAGSLLIWESIQYTKNKLGLNIYDFEGSMIESIETVRRSFGAKQVPYFQISKVNSNILKIRNFLKEVF